MTRPFIAALFSLAACGGPATLQNYQSSCTTTVSGAVTGTLTQDCEASAGFDSVKNVAGFAVSMTDPSFGAVSFTADFKNTSFVTGTYDSSSLTLSATTDRFPSDSSTGFWEQTSGTAASGNPLGTATLIITSTGASMTSNGTTVWFGSHGSVDATLKAAPGNPSTGDVTVHMTF